MQFLALDTAALFTRVSDIPRDQSLICVKKGVMYRAPHYRDRPSRVRWLARQSPRSRLRADAPAVEFDEIAGDPERGAIEIRHPELLTKGGPARGLALGLVATEATRAVLD